MSVAQRLSQRGKQVAELVALGLKNHEIAGRLFITERTVEWHIEQILNKLGFSSRSQIAAWVGRSQTDSAVPSPRQTGNLPSQLTSFVGRDRELRALLDLVTSNRLVTVTGTGGTGKTRLALRLGEELVTEFPDGVWLCDLAPVADPMLFADAITKSLDIKRPGRNRLEAIREHLRDRSVLLVLDNCEHLAPTAAAVAADLLAACCALRILATSRRPLGVIGEAICRLDPLSEAEAVELFIDRARAAVPDFRPDEESIRTVSTVCSRLDRVPLAIELVVPRLRVQTPNELQRYILDPAWAVRTSVRHGSLRAVAEWSYGLMNVAERALFRDLAIFSSWFDADDASAISPAAETSTPVLLGSLVEQSMLVQDMSAALRYRLLDTLRAFALEKLSEEGELSRVRLLHADHIVTLVKKSQALPVRLKLTAMVDDVRAALGTLLSSGPDQALWLNGEMMPIWRFDCRYQEGLAWNERVLAANPEQTAQRCRNLFQHAMTLIELGRADEAQPSLLEAERIADLPGNAELRRENLIVRANCYGMRGDSESGRRLGEEAIEVFAIAADTEMLGRALNHTALCLLALGRLRDGKRYAERALALQPGPTPARMATLDTMAQAHALLGELQPARTCWREAIERGTQVGWKNGIPFCFFGLAYVAGLEGDRAEAIRLHCLAEKLNAELNVNYYDPIARPEGELLRQLMDQAGPAEVDRLRSERHDLEAALT